MSKGPPRRIPKAVRSTGSILVIRDETWLVTRVERATDGWFVDVQGLSEPVRDAEAMFSTPLDDIRPLDPAKAEVVADDWPQYRSSRLWLEATLRKTAVPLNDPHLTVATQGLADLLPWSTSGRRRSGRGVALDRVGRKIVWDVVQSHRATSSVDGSVDFGEAAGIAAELLDSRPTRPVDHVLVDEGQDLNPTHWHFLRASVDEGPDDILIAEDVQQRIYGQRVVLGRFGIKIVGRSRRLALKYRTTAQNLAFAVVVPREGDYLDLEAEEADNPGYRSARRGPAPRLLGHLGHRRTGPGGRRGLAVAREQGRSGDDRHPGARRRPGQSVCSRTRSGGPVYGSSPTRRRPRNSRR